MENAGGPIRQERGCFTDWVTQRWVQYTGRRVDLREEEWLDGPMGQPAGIGKNYFVDLAAELGLDYRVACEGAGLLRDFQELNGPEFAASEINPSVVHFYEHTAGYAIDAWAEWCGVFRPFGALLALIFSRRLQQLNVPLSGLDTSRGVTNDVIILADPATGNVRYTAWLRELVGSHDVLYAGVYSTCSVPNRDVKCVKVVLPLPNGYAAVVLKPQLMDNGALLLASVGKCFGDPGFYFVTINADCSTSARYVRAMQESFYVYCAEESCVRADHVLKLFGLTFLRLHYRLRPPG